MNNSKKRKDLDNGRQKNRKGRKIQKREEKELEKEGGRIGNRTRKNEKRVDEALEKRGGRIRKGEKEN